MPPPLPSPDLFSAPTKLGVASGVTFADALSGGAFLAHVDGPLLLSAPTTLPASTSSYLQTVRTTVLTSTVFGGPMALAPTVVTAVRSCARAPCSRHHSTSVQTSARGSPPVSTAANNRAASLRCSSAASSSPAACSKSARLVCNAASRCWSALSAPSRRASCAVSNASSRRPTSASTRARLFNAATATPESGSVRACSMLPRKLASAASRSPVDAATMPRTSSA